MVFPQIGIIARGAREGNHCAPFRITHTTEGEQPGNRDRPNAMADRIERTKSGKFASGNSGRPKGAQNKTTALLKDAILKAAERAGNKVGNDGIISYLALQAEENPGPFMSLLGKVLPMDVTSGGDKISMPHEIIIRAANVSSDD